MRPVTLETRLLNRIERKRGDVFVRADFEDLGGYEQVGRALRGLIRKRELVKVGQGRYARARTSIMPRHNEGTHDHGDDRAGRLADQSPAGIAPPRHQGRAQR
jgi:hypothetical protein